MNFIRSLIGGLILAFLAYVAVYAFFALFQTIGFWWSSLILFILFFVLLLAVPDPTNLGSVITINRTL